KAGNCGGTIVWTINYGYVASLRRNPPMEAVKAAFLGEASPTLTVARAGTGAGVVTSSPAGINCGTSCSATFSSGTVVTLTASPVAGSSFSGWSGACSGTGPCHVTMSAARSVTGTFTARSLSINDVVLDEGNTGTRNAVFTVTLSPAAPTTVTVNY